MTKAEYAFFEVAFARENAHTSDRPDYDERIQEAVEAVYAERLNPELRDIFFDALTAAWVGEQRRYAVVAGVPEVIVNRWYSQWAKTIRPQLKASLKGEK